MIARQNDVRTTVAAMLAGLSMVSLNAVRRDLEGKQHPMCGEVEDALKLALNTTPEQSARAADLHQRALRDPAAMEQLCALRTKQVLNYILASVNIEGGDAFHLMAGNLSFQIEHHLFPDMPSNRLKEISPKVKAVCEEYGLPYNSGPFWQQWFMVQRSIVRYAFPGGDCFTLIAEAVRLTSWRRTVQPSPIKSCRSRASSTARLAACVSSTISNTVPRSSTSGIAIPA